MKEAVMTDQETAITTDDDPQDRFTYEDLLDIIRAPLKHRYAEGPWSSTYLAPATHRSETFWFEPLSLPVRDIDFAAYWSSADHIHRSLEWGFPGPDIPNDPEFTLLDMWGEWVLRARGEKYGYAALTHGRDRELGCAYLTPPVDGDDPYEAGLHIWAIEEGLQRDIDLKLLSEFLAWIQAGWDLNSVLLYTPESYQRTLDIAAEVGLRRVDREGPQPGYACFRWARS
jgi:hypothetical protein